MEGEGAADEQGTAGVDEVAYAASTSVDRAVASNADWAEGAGPADGGDAAYVVRAVVVDVPSTLKPDDEPAAKIDAVAAEATGPVVDGCGQVGVDFVPVASVKMTPGTYKEALGKPVCEGPLPW